MTVSGKEPPPDKPKMAVQIAIENPISSNDVAILYALTDLGEIYCLRDPTKTGATWQKIL